MVKVVFVIALLGLIAVQVECMKCYSCKECDEAKDSIDCKDEGLPASAQSYEEPETRKTTTTDAPTTEATAVDSSSLECFKLVLTEGDSTKVHRGCTRRTCENFKTQYGENYKECSTCSDKDDCNPASNVKSWALSSVILVAIMKMFL